MADEQTQPARRSTPPFWFPDIQGFLALGILLFVFLAFIFLIYGPTDRVKDAVLATVTVVIGVLTGALKDVYSYYFPGSKDTSGNAEAIKQLAMADTPAPPKP